VAKAKSAGEGSPEKILDGVTLSRTIPPMLPANFLARSALVDSFSFQAPGTTLIVGPIGYGKTSLATEIAHRNTDRTFWYTMVDEDSPARFNAHVIQSVRNVIPGFAPWFNEQMKIEPMDLIVKFSNELTTYKGDYIFIVDNRRTKDAQDFAVAAQMIRSLPRNLHLVQIRRSAPGASVAELAPTGSFQTIGPSELKFNAEEVKLLRHQ
jgi:ATP/maltotriose-dependent transcriptional regulator MalT